MGLSHCVYDGNIRLTYLCLYKVAPNTIEIVFSVSPFIDNLKIADYSGLTLTPKGILTIEKIEFKDKQMKLTVLYS